MDKSFKLNEKKMIFIYLFLIFSFLFSIIIINTKNSLFYSDKNNLIKKKSKLNVIKVEQRVYYNKSFGLNYLDMCQKEYLMKFNRNIPNLNSNILITLILVYSDPFIILKRKFEKYIDIISSEINFNFSIAIITCNHDISNLLIKNSSEIKIKFISKIYIKNIEIPNSNYLSFVTHSRNKTIDIFYINTQFSKFDNNFLNKIHFTPISNVKFRGYYAAGTNYYAYAPSHLGIFDYFDFFIKFDHDLINILKREPTFEPFPLKKMIENNKYFFFSCFLMNDANFVTTNLYQSFFLFSLKQNEKCNYTVLPINLYKYKESLAGHGKVNICWLGFYSMLQIRYFTEEYLSASYGLYKNRWGDQQFFVPTLFGFGFQNFSYFNNNTYLCSWTKKK